MSTVYQLPVGKGWHWLSHGVLSQVLGGWDTNFNFLGRSGQALNPSWGGASNICATAAATGCVPASIAGLAPTSTDPANLSNAAGSITGYSRPSILSNCQLIPAKQTELEWYNPACFVSPASPLVGPGYGFGNAPIGDMRSMRWINMDVALVKEIVIGENKKIEIRAEAFNVFNHMIWGSPGNSIAPSYSSATSSVAYGSAGVITSIANTPRDMQLAAKFMF